MKKVAVVCLPGLESFLPDIVKFLKSKYEVKTCFNGNNEELKSVILWADTVWIEWANELAVVLTKSNIIDGKHSICRVHSYEALSGHVGAVDWNKLDDVIFVADHIRDLTFQQLTKTNMVTKDFRTHVIPNGVDVDKFKFSHRKSGKNIAFLGNVNAKKGPMLLLHAFYELVNSSVFDYHLYIGGAIQEPRFGLYLSHIVKEMELEDVVHFEGFIQDVPKWLDDKNCIVCTSPIESQGLGIMEAMCMGIKPVIHNFVGARNIYDEKYLWTTIPEFIGMIDDEEYNSLEYRNFISKNYLLRHRLKEIAKIIDDPPEKPAVIVQDPNQYTEYGYWNRRPIPTDPNMSPETNQKHIDYISSHLKGSCKVFDFGPGIGRTFEAYKEMEYVEGCDISRLYEVQVKAEAERIGFKFKLIHLDLVELGRLPYADNDFDVAVASEVLLHQRPENILLVMSELVRIANKVIVISWYEERVNFNAPGLLKPGMNHCFHYNYPQICKDNDWKVYDIETADRQVYFVYEKVGD